MNVLHFFRPMLDGLNDGKVVRSSIAQSLKVLGLLTVVGGIYILINVLKTAFDMPTEGTIGGLVLAAVLLASFITAAQLLFYGAANVKDLDDSSFIAIPVCSILLRILGEIYSVLGLAVGIGGCIFIWLSKDNPLYLLGEMTKIFPSTFPEMTFFGGIFFLSYFALVSLVVFVLSYFLSEAVLLMADIGKNMRFLLRQSGGTSHR